MKFTCIIFSNLLEAFDCLEQHRKKAREKIGYTEVLKGKFITANQSLQEQVTYSPFSIIRSRFLSRDSFKSTR